MTTAIKRYEDQIVSLRPRIAELKEKWDQANPEVSKLVSKVVELREVRDKLQFQYDEMVAKSQEREINIKYNVR